MKRDAVEYRKPYRAGDYALISGGSRGVYWEGRDGLVVRMAVAERNREADRIRPWWAIFNAMSSSNAFAR
jgi:hypothetical protein